MGSDKKIIEHLLNALESALIDQTMLMTMIATYRQRFPEIGDWQRDLVELRIQKGPDVKKEFSRMRDAVSRSGDLEQALQQFSKGILPKGPVH